MTYRGSEEQMRAAIETAREDVRRATEQAHKAVVAQGEASAALAQYRMSLAKARAVQWTSLAFGASFGAFIVVGLGYAIDACARDRSASLTAGVVTDRYYSPAHDTHGVICHQVGKVSVCTPTTTHHPDLWRIRFDHDGVSRVVSVSHADFDDSHVGSWFRIDGSHEAEPDEEIVVVDN